MPRLSSRSYRSALALVCLAIHALLPTTESAAAENGAAERDTPAALFERRIMPIFKSPNPSSCTQCHLAGVDLKNYILPSSEKTFASLRDQGLVDLAAPENSKILKLINMRDTAAGPSSDGTVSAGGGAAYSPADQQGADLIHEKTRQAEFEAFAEWIKACAADPKLASTPKLPPAELAGPQRPPEVIRHARKDALLESFENNVWALRFRCMSCHIEGTPENTKLRAEHGDQVAWIKQAGAAATMNYLIGSKLIDVEKPEKSLLLLKPLMEVDHGGGKKFIQGDQGYQAFRAWLEDYAKTVGDRYATAAALPKTAGQPAGFGTNLWFKLANTPPAWGESLVRTDIHAWDAAREAWEPAPIATTDRQNNAKMRIWQHTLTLLAAKESDRAGAWRSGKPTLPAGRYLVRVYVPRAAGQRFGGARAGASAPDWRNPPRPADYVGQAEFTANWGEGYGKMTAVDAMKLRP
jgi:hypothetical protein